MSAVHDESRDDRALDALLAAAYRLTPPDDDDVSASCEGDDTLSAEDLAALDALGSDLVHRITSGTYRSSVAGLAMEPADHHIAEPELAGAMNRGADADMSDAAREEMERRRQEIDAEDEAGGEDEDGDGPSPE